MCGIVGIVAKNNSGFYSAQGDALEQMLLADTLRGPDSTGVFGITKNGNVSIVKAAVPGYDFIQTNEYRNFRGNMIQRYLAVVGHNRKATKGSVKPENAHPFKIGDYTLVHNGTTWGGELNKQGEGEPEYEVDSHAICASMEKNGEFKTIKDINGAFALVWYNKKDKSLNLVRNHMRPLWLLSTFGFWLISSEPQLAHWVASRNEMRLDAFKKEANSDYKIAVWQIPEWVMISFDMEAKDRNEFIETKIDRFPITYTGPNDRQVETTKPDDTNNRGNLPVRYEDRNDGRSQAHHYGSDPEYEERNRTEGGIYKGRMVVVKPVDFQPFGDSGSHVRIIADIMTQEGDALPGHIAHFLVKKADSDFFTSTDKDYFSGFVTYIRGPKDRNSNKDVIVMISGNKPGDYPVPVTYGISKNKKFVPESQFLAATTTGCRKCQKMLSFANIEKYESRTDDKGKYRFYCEDCIPDLKVVNG